MIRFENVSKTFRGNGKQVEAVKEVSLHIKKGEIFGIIGYSGAGKSTLVRCINLLERPDRGRIWIGDTEITALKGKSLRKQRRKIGMIFQQFHLFASRNVYENVAYPLKHQGLTRQEIKKRVEELLNLVGLEDKVSAYPHIFPEGRSREQPSPGRLQTSRISCFATKPPARWIPRPPRQSCGCFRRLTVSWGSPLWLSLMKCR